MEYQTLFMKDHNEVAGVCTTMAKKGWRVTSAFPLTRNGSTVGISVLFERPITPSRASG